MEMPTVKEKYSDEELEEIIDMHATDQISMRQLRATIQENPLLITGLVFAFGLLIGIAMGKHRRSR